jgi:DeoR family transcriptional regulator, suf operon transcriptional repressor
MTVMQTGETSAFALERPVPALESMAASRRAILTALKKRGDAGVEQLARDLGVTVSAMRQHLAGLAADDLVEHSESRDGRGRPRHVYFLTARGDALFPRNYAEITNELLAYVDDADHELLDAIFRRRRDRRIRQAKARVVGMSFGERLAELGRILDEDGYMATVENIGDGTYRIVEHNCAIFGIARKYGQACSSEIEFIRNVLPEAEVTRISHIVAGERHCAYLVGPR